MHDRLIQNWRQTVPIAPPRCIVQSYFVDQHVGWICDTPLAGFDVNFAAPAAGKVIVS